MRHVLLKNPAMNLNKHEAKRLIEYAKESYFKHLRLYEFVFNNKAPNEVKRINFIEEQARNEQPLSASLQISAGRPIPYQESTMTMQDAYGEQPTSLYEMDQEAADGNDMEDYDNEDMDEPMDMDYN